MCCACSSFGLHIIHINHRWVGRVSVLASLLAGKHEICVGSIIPTIFRARPRVGIRRPSSGSPSRVSAIFVSAIQVQAGPPDASRRRPFIHLTSCGLKRGATDVDDKSTFVPCMQLVIAQKPYCCLGAVLGTYAERQLAGVATSVSR